MQLTGGVRSIIICSAQLYYNPLNLSTTANKLAGEININELRNGIHIINMPNDHCEYEQSYNPTNQFFSHNIIINHKGNDIYIVNRLIALGKQYNILLNLYAMPPKNWLCIGDNLQPITLVDIISKSRNSNSQNFTNNIKFSGTTRNTTLTTYM